MDPTAPVTLATANEEAIPIFVDRLFFVYMCPLMAGSLVLQIRPHGNKCLLRWMSSCSYGWRKTSKLLSGFVLGV